MIRPRPALLAAALLLSGAPGHALEVSTRPSQVTVFPQGARVVRIGEARVPAGAAKLVFPDLPAAADERSLRFSASGPKGTRVFGIQIASAYTPETVERRTRALQDRIRSLEDEKTDLADRNAARNAELEILKNLAKDAAARVGDGAAVRPAAVAELAGATAAVARRIAVLLSDSRKDERAQRPLDERIGALRRELAQAGGGARERKVAEADLSLSAEGVVRVELSYLVQNASWSPLYDLRLDPARAKPIVSLAMAGQVRQRSGEDWKEVKLTLSTARPSEGSQAPDPTQWWLDFPQRTPSRKRAYGAAASAAPVSRAMERMESAGAELDEAPAEVAAAETVRSEFATAFSVARPADVPSDGSAARVGIAQSEHDASLLLVAVPRLQGAAFIEAEVGYEGDQPLLPGAANLFRGEEFVGQTQMKAVAPGERFTFGFGQDDNVKVERKLVTEKAGGGSLFTRASRRYRWVTTVKSFHAGPRVLEVREQLPRSRRKEIVVEPAEISPAPLPEDPERPGLNRFRLELAPRTEVKVVFGYQVKFPEGTEVSGLE